MIKIEGLIPEGVYTLKVESLEEHLFRTGTLGVRIAFRIEKTPPNLQGVFDREVIETYPCEGQGAGKLLSLLKILGINIDGDVILSPNDIKGKTFSAKIVHEEYEGIPRLRIKPQPSPQPRTAVKVKK